MTAFVNLPYNQLTVGIVGVSKGSKWTEAADLVNHFQKNGVKIASVSIGIFDRDLSNLSRLIDISKPMKDAPSCKHREYAKLIYDSKLSKLPIQAAGRHKSHAIVRMSWMAWDYPRETMRIIYELLTLSLSKKILSPDGSRYLDKIAPHISHPIYTEPAMLAILKTLKNLKYEPGSAVVLALPLHLVDPAVKFLHEEFVHDVNRIKNITDDDVNVLMARGASYWPLLSLVWLMIPCLALTVGFRWSYDTVKASRRSLLSGGVDARHAEDVKGLFGVNQWVRDTSRD